MASILRGLNRKEAQLIAALPKMLSFFLVNVSMYVCVVHILALVSRLSSCQSNPKTNYPAIENYLFAANHVSVG